MAIEIGFGTYNITPPLGVSMAGYAQREGVASGVHDELSARAVAFADDAASAMLIMADVCSVPPEACVRTAEVLQERIGIPADNVIVAAVHTHSGPVLRDDDAYSALFPELLVSAGQVAWDARQPGQLAFGTGQAPGLCINRRVPDGPVDEEFRALVARGPDGRCLGVLFSYPLHGVVMGHTNLSISADYLGVARRAIEAALPGATAVFCAAASGDMNPMTPTVERLAAEGGEGYWTDDPVTGIYDRSNGTFEEVELLGRRLGEAVLAGLDGCEPLPPAPLTVQRWTVNLGSEQEVPADLAAIGEHLIDTGAKLQTAAADAGRRCMILTHAGRLCYVPPPEEFDAGGYEIASALRRGLARDAQQRLCAGVRERLFGTGTER
jgi:hypothetical protein